jgi:hypothetical protein
MCGKYPLMVISGLFLCFRWLQITKFDAQLNWRRCLGCILLALRIAIQQGSSLLNDLTHATKVHFVRDIGVWLITPVSVK